MRKAVLLVLITWLLGSSLAFGDGPPLELAGHAVHPDWSSDGAALIFEAGPDGDRQIVELSLADGLVRRLTDGPHVLAAPAVSRSGESIAFLRLAPDDIDLMVMKRDGSGMRQLTSIEGAPSLLSWTPDDRVVFVSQVNGQQFDVFAVDLDGRKEQLTHSPYDERVPDMSPDGRSVVFQSNHLDAGDVFTTSVADGVTRRLTSIDGRQRIGRWSPTGDRIAFQSDHLGQYEIFVLHLDTEETRQITNHSGSDSIPAWSPDARHIAFVSNRPREGEEASGLGLYAVDLENGELRCLSCGARYVEATAPD